jgi:hypothetical protein
MELPHGIPTDRPYRTFGICPGIIKFPTIIKMHKYTDRLSLLDLRDLSRDDQSLRYKILTELLVVGQDTIVSSASSPLSREVLSDYTKLVSKVLKLYTRQRLGQHICDVLTCANILELYGSPLHHIRNVVIPDFYGLRLVMEHVVLCHLYATLAVT